VVKPFFSVFSGPAGDPEEDQMRKADYTEMWQSLGLDLAAHDGLLGVLGQAYKDIYLSQKSRPRRMDYFDFVISEIHGLRIQELLEARQSPWTAAAACCGSR